MYSSYDLLLHLKLTWVQDIRELALHLTGQAQSPSWLQINNRTSIQRIVVLLVPGITPDVFDPPLRPQTNTSNPLLHIPETSTSSQLPFLSKFLHAVPTKAPGDAQRMHSVLHGFFMGPVTGEERKRRMAERIKGVHIWRFLENHL
jgi:RNA exonuclease 1